VSPAHSAHENDEPIDEGGASEIDIETIFRRMIAGAHLLSRRERAQAGRAAREWRRIALRALHEKRRSDRYARYMHRQLKRIKRSNLNCG
jgi:hypothetical protein